jgi:hypothetical protein
VTQDQRGRLLGGQAAKLTEQVRTDADLGGVLLAWPAEPPDDLPDLPQPLSAQVRDGDVDRDPVQPGLCRRVLLPALPRVEGPQKCLLGAVLGRSPVFEQSQKGSEDSRVALAVEAVEVGLEPRL